MRSSDGGEREVERAQAQCGEEGRVCMDLACVGRTKVRRMIDKRHNIFVRARTGFANLGVRTRGCGDVVWVRLRGSVHFRTDFGEWFWRLTPTAKYNVSAMLPKYVAVKGSLSWEIRWRTGGSDQHSSYFGSTLVESAATSRARGAC